MHVHAHVAAVVRCPRCFTDVAPRGRIGFQWGYCPSTSDRVTHAYRVGDPILWRLDDTGRIHAWAYFLSSQTANVGDPNIGDVLVRESEFGIRGCGCCGHAFHGIGVLIRGGVIQHVQIFEHPLPASAISLINADGSLQPRPDWDDRPMIGLADNGWRELLTHYAEAGAHPGQASF